MGFEDRVGVCPAKKEGARKSILGREHSVCKGREAGECIE